MTVRFGLVGALNTAVSYLAFVTLIRIGVHFALATLVGNLLSLLLGFKLHGIYVFRNSGKGRFLRFVGIFTAMFGLSVGIQSVVRGRLNGYAAGALAALVTIPISFMLNGAWVFSPDRSKAKGFFS